jgi:hypothetical protein
MQKIFTLFLGMIIALSAVAAPAKKQVRVENAPAKAFFLKNLDLNNLKAHRAPKAIKDVTFDIVIDNITATTAAYSVTPSDDNAMFVFTYAEKAMIDTIADAQIAAVMKANLDDYIANAAKQGKDYTYADLLYSGAQEDEFDGLLPNTDYVAIAFEMDENGALVGQATRVAFHTENLVLSGDTIPYTFTDLAWNDKTATAGWWEIYSPNEEDDPFISLSNGTLVDAPEGTYDFADMDGQYCYLWIGENKITFAAGTVVVTKNLDGSYHVYAELADGNGDVYILTLDSKPFVPSDMTFQFQETADGIVVYASNETDPWDFFVVSEDVFNYYGADYIAQTIYNKYGDQYAEPGSGLLSFAETLAPYLETSGNYVLVVWGADGGVTTPAASYTFQYTVEGIEDVIAAGKAAKVVRDGQVLILKGDKAFNLQGAQVK